MPQRSAGILLYRRGETGVEVLLVHPGGPFWAKNDEGAWSIPKGLIDKHEDPLLAAKREFTEETGGIAAGETIPLGAFKQPGGKIVTAYAAEGNFDLTDFSSTSFTMEWPPRSGRQAEFPEADRAEWFPIEDARAKILKGHAAMLDALVKHLG
jgi:predicted NUDIX family NTP pyrophosphohydrolase